MSSVLRPLLRGALRLLALLTLAHAGAFGTTTDASSGWRFLRGDVAGAESPAFDDHAWERVDAPHTARIEALVTSPRGHQQWEGLCWYRKAFELPVDARGQVVRLRFEGAMNRVQVFVNGTLRTESIDGYTPFVVDLTPEAARPGPISVALRLDNRHSLITGPKPLDQLDFHLYHGLYRGVTLSVQPPLHLTDELLENIPGGGGVFVTYPEVSDARASVAVQTHVRNAGAKAARFTLVTTLRTLDGAVVARNEQPDATLDPGLARTWQPILSVPQPKLWSPQTPHLYDLDVDILVDGRVTDHRRERIGIRRIEFVGTQFLLNGRPLFLRGVNRHQEYPYVGNAVPDRAQYRDALKIKQAGFDYIRLSHYPQSPAFMAACDELGIITMDAMMGWQFNPGTPEFVANRLAAARALVRRDRNHPSAVFWEVALNETGMKPEFIAALHAAAHEEYPGDQMFTAGWVKGYDIKVTARQHHSTEEFRKTTAPSIVSEYGDWEYYAGNAGLNQQSWQNLKSSERNSRQLRGDGEVRLLQQATNLQEAHNDNRSTRAFADGYWVMYDYNRGYADDLEASGTMDIFRLPKLSTHFFRSQRDAGERVGPLVGGPMVHIATWWTPASPLAVRVYANGDEVELSLNGRSLGRRTPDRDARSTHLAHPPFTFTLPAFEAGELKAVSFIKGAPVAEHRVRTPEAPARLALSIDESGRPLAAGGDLVFVYAAVVDAHGTVVPGNEHAVTFTLEGDAELIGDNPIRAEAGIATILVKTKGQPGPLRLRAEAGTLRGELRHTVVPASGG